MTETVQEQPALTVKNAAMTATEMIKMEIAKHKGLAFQGRQILQQLPDLKPKMVQDKICYLAAHGYLKRVFSDGPAAYEQIRPFSMPPTKAEKPAAKAEPKPNKTTRFTNATVTLTAVPSITPTESILSMLVCQKQALETQLRKLTAAIEALS